MSDPNHNPRPGVRWWPLPALLVVLVGGIFASLRWGGGDLAGPLAVLTVFLVFVGLVIWLLFLSRLSRGGKRGGCVGILVFLALAASMFQVKGYTGSVVPIIGLRWLDDTAADLTASEGAVELVPSPYDSPSFPGPDGQPRFNAPVLQEGWSSTPPKELWRRPLGEGFSSFAVIGDFAFTQSQRGDEECVVCLHWPTGETRWVHADSVYFQSSFGGNGPRATPTVAEGRVYTLGATGLLRCLDARNGALLWGHDLVADFSGEPPQWGYSGSPLVIDGRVIVSSGDSDGRSLLAFDAVSGEPVWQAGTRRAAYASPVHAVVSGLPVILVVDGEGIAAHDPEDGTLRWSVNRGRGENVSQPLVFDGESVFHSKGYGGGAGLWKVSVGADSGASVAPVWKSRRVMKSKFCNPVMYEQHLYGISDGVAMECIDPRTGESRWRERGPFGHGQLIGTGAHLLVMTEQGELLLVAADPSGYRELARHRVFDARTWNPPVLIGKHLLARNDLEAVCLELPAQGDE